MGSVCVHITNLSLIASSCTGWNLFGADDIYIYVHDAAAPMLFWGTWRPKIWDYSYIWSDHSLISHLQFPVRCSTGPEFVFSPLQVCQAAVWNSTPIFFRCENATQGSVIWSWSNTEHNKRRSHLEVEHNWLKPEVVHAADKHKHLRLQGERLSVKRKWRSDKIQQSTWSAELRSFRVLERHAFRHFSASTQGGGGVII